MRSNRVVIFFFQFTVVVKEENDYEKCRYLYSEDGVMIFKTLKIFVWRKIHRQIAEVCGEDAIKKGEREETVSAVRRKKDSAYLLDGYTLVFSYACPPPR